MKATVVSVAVIIGLAFIGLAALYWLTPAGDLPAFLPGFKPGSVKPHFNHGLGPDYWTSRARPSLVPQQSRLGPVKTPLRPPKIDPEWQKTIILAGVIALLYMAIAVVVAVRYF